MKTYNIIPDNISLIDRGVQPISIFHSEKMEDEVSLLRALFTVTEIYKYPEGSKFSGKSEYRATKNGYNLNILPTTKGYQVYLGIPGKDPGNINTFGLIESWFPQNSSELMLSIRQASELIKV